MPDLQQPLMIITDLDGSLLDHHTYRWDVAIRVADHPETARHPAGDLFQQDGGRNYSVTETARHCRGSPFIAENGAMVDREGQRIRLPDNRLTYDAICARLAVLQTQYRFSGFYDFTDQAVSAMTGLNEADAALSRQRDASEVMVWRDSDETFDRFRDALTADGLALTQGGRFWHVMPAGSGKGEAVRWLLSQQPSAVRTTIGLGDSPNDAPILDAVDYAVVIKGYSKTPVSLSRTDQQQVYHTAHYGPEGWREGPDYFLTQPQRAAHRH